MAKFDLAFEKVLAHEGGYVNDPDDPGGETYKGIARKMNPGWLGWHIIDLLKKQKGFPDLLHSADETEVLKQLDYEEKTFYYSNFWIKISGDKIENQLVANSIFDFAVNADDNVSIQLAQLVVGARQDGLIGPKTVEAINRFDPAYFLIAFALAKINRYVAICNKRPLSKKYFFGWVVRSLNHAS
jgi:lysozyme family protein